MHTLFQYMFSFVSSRATKCDMDVIQYSSRGRRVIHERDTSAYYGTGTNRTSDLKTRSFTLQLTMILHEHDWIHFIPFSRSVLLLDKMTQS